MASVPVSRLAGNPQSTHIGLLLIPALVLSLVAAGSNVLPGDVAVTLFIQEHTPAGLHWLVDAVNAAGTTVGAILITVALALTFYLRGHGVPAGLLLLTLPLRLWNGLLKLLMESPRPSDTMVQVNEYASGFGFPSGHTMGATLLYGALFLLAPYVTSRRGTCLVVRAVSLAMILLAGLSRIHAGAHWPSDVVGAYLWALVLLIAGMLIVQRRGLLSDATRS